MKMKIRQIVWIRYSVFSKILEMAEEKGKAPNQIITDIISKYFSDNHKENVVEKILYECPYCYTRFSDAASLRKHLEENHRKF